MERIGILYCLRQMYHNYDDQDPGFGCLFAWLTQGLLTVSMFLRAHFYPDRLLTLRRIILFLPRFVFAYNFIGKYFAKKWFVREWCTRYFRARNSVSVLQGRAGMKNSRNAILVCILVHKKRKICGGSSPILEVPYFTVSRKGVPAFWSLSSTTHLSANLGSFVAYRDHV